MRVHNCYLTDIKDLPGRLPMGKVDTMATKDAQINLRLPTDLDNWLSERAGGSRQKPSFIRDLLERERAKEEEAEMQAMFDHAWDTLSPEEREAERAERAAVLGAYGGNEES